MNTLMDVLLESKMITEDHVKAVKRYKKIEPNKTLSEILVDLNFMSQKDLIGVAHDVYGLPIFDIEKDEVDPAATKFLTHEIARRYSVFPLREEDGSLYVAMDNPLNVMKLDDLRHLTKMRIQAVYATKGQIGEWIDKYYQMEDILHHTLNMIVDEAKNEGVREHGGTKVATAFDVNSIHGDHSSVIKLLNLILNSAVQSKASDIHIEPQAKFVQISFRVDGSLRNMMKIPNVLRSALAARIKIIAELNITENRKPQDGRTAILVDHRKIDLRISVTPTFYGEKFVMRLLDAREARMHLEKIGFDEDEKKLFIDALRKPQGMILLTGPTGCGKTSTLYSALNFVKQNEVDNIVTIEDPIEYLIDGVNQIQVNPVKNVTFANALRSILRQDPNVILVGEIRDKETAEIALRASLTGHLVFSTLHTNNAVSSITRLMDIGLESYLISSSLIMVVAQRLVRLICSHCKETYQPEERLFEKFGVFLAKVQIEHFYRGRGCDECGMTGYSGRTAIFEIIRINEKLKALIANNAREDFILKEARNNGLKSLAESGVQKVLQGLTTLEEIEKVADVMEMDKHQPVASPWLSVAATKKNPYPTANLQTEEVQEAGQQFEYALIPE